MNVTDRWRRWRRNRAMGEGGSLQRLRWIRNCPAEDLLVLKTPEMYDWTAEQLREEGEKVRAEAIAIFFDEAI